MSEQRQVEIELVDADIEYLYGEIIVHSAFWLDTQEELTTIEYGILKGLIEDASDWIEWDNGECGYYA